MSPWLDQETGRVLWRSLIGDEKMIIDAIKITEERKKN